MLFAFASSRRRRRKKMRLLAWLPPLFLIFLVAGSAQSLPINSPVPDNATIVYNGLVWAWAAPCNPVDPSCGVIDLSFQGALGWHIPSAEEFALAPQATDFVFAGANVPFGGIDPVSGALFNVDAALTGDAACAAPYFSTLHYHCDFGDAPGGGGAEIPWGEDAGFLSWSEALVVRPIPEPAAAGLFGIGLLVVGRALRRKA
jgi:hypothetical protein